MVLPLVFSCEHATSHIPAPWAKLLGFSRTFLQSHRGFDRGAAWLAKRLAAVSQAPLILAKTSRLLIDLNRSPHHPQRWHKRAKALGAQQQDLIVRQYYQPHWQQVGAACLQAIVQEGQVLHLGVHSFTPTLRGTRREVDIGVLYDPQRPLEHSMAQFLLQSLQQQLPGWRIVANQPYTGYEDGMTTAFRQIFAPSTYLGIELEINQTCFRKVQRNQRAKLLSAFEALFRSFHRTNPFTDSHRLTKTL